ncbi:hypothetical protein D3C72_902000 [compost metagenome]
MRTPSTTSTDAGVSSTDVPRRVPVTTTGAKVASAGCAQTLWFSAAVSAAVSTAVGAPGIVRRQRGRRPRPASPTRISFCHAMPFLITASVKSVSLLKCLAIAYAIGNPSWE